MRQSARTDTNQIAIVQALRQAGATVQILSQVGKGCPDLLCGFSGQNYLMEIKDGARVPSERQLTPDEQAWHARWKGDVLIVESIDDALQAIGAIA